MDTNRRHALKAILAGAGGFALGDMGRALAQQNAIQIGVIYPLSGTVASSGKALLAGAQIAMEQINKSGGVLGRPIELVIRDDKGNAAEAGFVGRELLGSGIKILQGIILQPNVRAISPALLENDALLVTSTTQMSVTHEEFLPNMFRCQLSSRMNLFAASKVIADNHPAVTKWGTVSPDLQFGATNWATVKAALTKFYKENGASPTFAEPIWHKFGATDYRVQINAVIASGVEAIYGGSFGADIVTFLTQAKQLGMFEKVRVFLDSGSGIAAPRALGTNVPNVDFWSPTQWYADDPNANPTSKALAQAYKALTNEPIADALACLGHSGMWSLAYAIKAAGNTEAPAVRAALEQVSFEAANGPFRYRKEDHQALMSAAVIKVGQKSSSPGWEVTKVVPVSADAVIEPPTPGKAYEET